MTIGEVEPSESSLIKEAKRRRLEDEDNLEDNNTKPPSPAASLSDDLLREIFFHIAISNPNCFKLAHSLWPPALVCSHWKDVIMTSPLLWTYISIRARTAMPIPKESRVLSRSLELSRGLPLKVSYYRPVDHTFDLLMTDSRRWQSLFIGDIPEHFLKGAQHTFPLLEELNGLAWSTTLIEAFKDSPRLRHVFLDFSSELTQINIALPWSQIESFETRRKEPGRHIFQKCTQLRRYELRGTLWPAQLDIVDPPLRSTLLRELSLTSPEELDSFDLPVLESLEIWGPPNTNLFSILNRFSSRSRCPLSSFTVRELGEVQPLEITKFLQSNPLIVDFSFSFLDVEPKDMIPMFKLLTIDKSASTPLLPQLDHLCVGVHLKKMNARLLGDFDHGPLLGLIHSRLVSHPDVTRLKRLKIWTHRDMKTSSVPQIQALWEVEGLSFDLGRWTSC